MVKRKNIIEDLIKSYKKELRNLKDEEEIYTNKDFNFCHKIEDEIFYYKNISDKYKENCNELLIEIENLKNRINKINKITMENISDK
jgi:hypothetical protein